MKKIYTAKHPTEAHLVRGLLESYDISCEVRGEALFSARGELPVTTDTLPSVWIRDPIDYLKAKDIVADYDTRKNSNGIKGPPWSCPTCGEEIEAQFSACWQCGTDKP